MNGRLGWIKIPTMLYDVLLNGNRSLTLTVRDEQDEVCVDTTCFFVVSFNRQFNTQAPTGWVKYQCCG